MKILVAEDDRPSAILLERTLRRLGYDVAVARDGGEAWDRYRLDPTPVVITDWVMPGLSGPELVQRIRSARRGAYTYVLILTSRTGKENFLEGMDAGADDYLTKPFDPDTLAARLRVAERILGLKAEVSRLEGLLPICSYCKKIRDDADEWTGVESYIARRSEASFTHSICPSCYETRVEAELAELDRGA